MKVRFIKLNHQVYRLELLLANKRVYRKDLEARSYFRHDLMHYFVEAGANLKDSFYGSFKYSQKENDAEIMDTEGLVAILQNMDKDPQFSPQAYLEKIEVRFEAVDGKVPEYLTKEFIEEISPKYFRALRVWEKMKTGENSALEMEF
jgi:hypothetical protein